MKKWITTSLLTLSLVLPAASFAQSSTQQKLARQAVTLQQGSEQQSLWSNMANSAASVSLEKWAERAMSDVSENKLSETSKKLDAELEKLYNSVYKLLETTSPKVEAEELTNFYANNFTEAELKALVAWLESPTFKKYMQLAPEMANVYVNALMERTNTKVQDLQGEFDTKAAAIINAAKK